MSWILKNLYQVTATPYTRGMKLVHNLIGTYGKGKKWGKFDYVLIMVKMCSSEPKTNLYDNSI